MSKLPYPRPICIVYPNEKREYTEQELQDAARWIDILSDNIMIKCWNCGKEFKKFRFQYPFQNTCKSCIPNQFRTGKKQRKLKM